MPEVLTRYPNIVIDLLKGMGANCGRGPKEILVDCPTKNFCTVPNGEMCILGLNDSNKLTHFSANAIEQTGGKNGNNTFWLALLVVIILVVIIYFLKRYRYYRQQQQLQNDIINNY